MKNIIIFLTLFLVSCSETSSNWAGCYEGELEHRMHLVLSDHDYVSTSVKQVQVLQEGNRYFILFEERKVFLNHRGKGKIHFSEFPFGGRKIRYAIELEIDIEGESMEYLLIQKEWDYQTVETVSTKKGILNKSHFECD